MPTKTEIANMALGQIGQGAQIGNIDSDKSAAAAAVRRVWDTALDMVLRDFDWPFARKLVGLSLIEENPTSEWAYSYQKPSDCVMFRRILSGTRNDSPDTAVAYVISHGTSGEVIYSDLSEAEGQYTKRVTETGRFPPDFTLAFASLIGALVVPSISGGDPFKIRDSMFAFYNSLIVKAKINAANEEKREKQPASSLQAARR